MVIISAQYGLKWKQEMGRSRPIWSQEPDIDVIRRIAQTHLGRDTCEIKIKPYAEGSFNKIYQISAADTNYIMRVSLPVDPFYKTESEAATIEFVRENTDIPVPRILAYDSDNQNELKFEWMLMEMMPGTPLLSRWNKITFTVKEKIVRRLALYQAQLYEKRFNGIGNLYFQECGDPASRHKPTKSLSPEPSQSYNKPQESGKPQCQPEHQTSEMMENRPQDCKACSMARSLLNHFKVNSTSFQLGRMVDQHLFWDERLTYDVPRGPFKLSHEWLRTLLHVTITATKAEHQTLKAQNGEDDEDDEDDLESLEEVLEGAELLLEVMPKLFSTNSTEAESCILFHDDLNQSNILVDEEGELTAVLDWEAVPTMPLWYSHRMPKLLDGNTREKEPDRIAYRVPADAARDDSVYGEDSKTLYWKHLAEYETMLLQRVFIDEMQKIKPEWVKLYRDSDAQKDFEFAVREVDHGLFLRPVISWSQKILQGKTEPLFPDMTML